MHIQITVYQHNVNRELPVHWAARFMINLSTKFNMATNPFYYTPQKYNLNRSWKPPPAGLQHTISGPKSWCHQLH